MEIDGENVFAIQNNQPEPQVEDDPAMPVQPVADPVVLVHRIPRPPNAYILYRKDNHHLVKAANPGIHNNEICEYSPVALMAMLTSIAVILGAQWNNETTEVRDEYTAKAERVKEEFMKANPNYKYQPRRPEEKKRRAKRARVDAENIPNTTAINEDELHFLENEADSENEADPPVDLDVAPHAMISLAEETAVLHGDDISEFNREFEGYYIAPDKQA